MNMYGWYLVDKPAGMSSHRVCQYIRKQLNTKKVGHTGTLDPFATGLLVVAVGKATKLIPLLEKAEKEYEATVIFGQTSETLDPESDIVDCEYDGEPPTLPNIEKALKDHFTGIIQQIPPQYSAIKQDGVRAYALARKGEKVEMKPRETEVLEWEILSYDYPTLKLRIRVRAGFYVRALARDLGEMLAGGGYCSELRRISVSHLSIDDANTMEELGMPIDPKYIFPDMPYREIPAGRVQDFSAGRAWPCPGVNGEQVLVLLAGKTIGMAEITDGKLQPRVVF